MNRSKNFACVALSLVCLSLAACSAAAPQEKDVIAALESFYGAMKTGDAAAAMKMVAPDAVFVESGRIETRAEYEANHLPSDIDFEKQVNGKRGPMQVKFQGNAAWVIATTEFVGTFEQSPVNFVSQQLAVLTLQEGQWLIRSIHWSSMRR